VAESHDKNKLNRSWWVYSENGGEF